VVVIRGWLRTDRVPSAAAFYAVWLSGLVVAGALHGVGGDAGNLCTVVGLALIFAGWGYAERRGVDERQMTPAQCTGAVVVAGVIAFVVIGALLRGLGGGNTASGVLLWVLLVALGVDVFDRLFAGRIRVTQ
jgi:hypothetical protein